MGFNKRQNIQTDLAKNVLRDSTWPYDNMWPHGMFMEVRAQRGESSPIVSWWTEKMSKLTSSVSELDKSHWTEIRCITFPGYPLV